MFVLRAESVTIFEPKMVTISARIYKYTENMQSSQGYIFCILQHFATKFFPILLNFIIFFLTVVFYSLLFT
jgi:hypothetical protein